MRTRVVQKTLTPGTFLFLYCIIIVTNKKREDMDDMINRHDSIAEENIEPNGRPAKNEFEEWSTEVTDRADNVFKGDTKDGPIKDREKRIKEMDEVIKKDLE